MNSNQKLPPLCIDTPNYLFRRNQFSDNQARKLEAFLDKNQMFDIILLLTVKMYCAQRKWTIQLKEKYKINPRVRFLTSKPNTDPDEILLSYAQNKGGIAVSNDQFKQRKYDTYRGVKKLSLEIIDRHEELIDLT